MFTIYGIKSCDACRKARRFLEQRNIEHRFHDLRDDGLDRAMLERWAGRVGWNNLLNRRSITWRKIPEVDRAGMTETNALATMLDNPTVIKRPIFEAGDRLEIALGERQLAEFIESSGVR